MSETIQVQIDVEAAKALARWKALFADEVCELAKQLASQSGQPNTVTLSHYKEAAQAALQSLSAAIHDGDTYNAGQKAA